jgi:hypothetical protein
VYLAFNKINQSLTTTYFLAVGTTFVQAVPIESVGHSPFSNMETFPNIEYRMLEQGERRRPEEKDLGLTRTSHHALCGPAKFHRMEYQSRYLRLVSKVLRLPR